jgi:Family of unknown function (DUF6345)
MKSLKIIGTCLLPASIAALALGTPKMAGAYTFLCEAPRWYNGHGCFPGLDNLGDEAGEIVGELQSDGWSGNWFESTNCWQTDFIDSSFGSPYNNGQDQYWADNVNLAIFLGHGNNGIFHFSDPDPYNGACVAGGLQNPNGLSLGKNNGKQAAIAIYGTCCTLNPNYLNYMAANNGTTQTLGFGSVASLDGGMVHEFYEDTQDTTTWWSWLTRMEDKHGFGTGDNSTVVLQAGWNLDNAAGWAQYCMIRGPQGCNSNIWSSQSGYWYWYWWMDHGRC